LVLQAGAADMPKAPLYKAPPLVVGYNWTGFYVGGHVGYGWGSDGGLAFTDFPPGSFAASFAATQTARLVGIDPKGFVGGGQLGYNLQLTPNWLIGIEGDFSGSEIKGSGTYTFAGSPGFAPTSQVVSQSLDWLATVRGRLGFVVDRFLVYGTGGVAFGLVKDSFNLVALTFPASVSGSASNTLTGWAGGAGAEYAFAGNWSAKVEWLHYDLGSLTASGPQLTAGVPQPFGLNGTAVTRGDIVRGGLNYKF
jgi:outer membrane immunogenic protein